LLNNRDSSSEEGRKVFDVHKQIVLTSVPICFKNHWILTGQCTEHGGKINCFLCLFGMENAVAWTWA